MNVSTSAVSTPRLNEPGIMTDEISVDWETIDCWLQSLVSPCDSGYCDMECPSICDQGACKWEQGRSGARILVEEQQARIERLDAALVFYAEGKHMLGLEDWDTVSGEPHNWLHNVENEDRIEAIEDGSIARKAREGK